MQNIQTAQQQKYTTNASAVNAYIDNNRCVLWTVNDVLYSLYFGKIYTVLLFWVQYSFWAIYTLL